ncbi:MAG TPA: phosphodiester glycosidase family protein [Blastocatellia bacterium]|nr:phosphodiester glycosidase family protein [Blastocatellia bacterium]
MLHKQSSPARLCVALAGIVFFSLLALAQSPLEQRTAATLAPGVEHIEIRRGDFTAESGDRWQIHVLIVDPAKAALKWVRAMDELVGSETTSSMAARHGAMAAINAGFFRVAGTYRGEPDGLLVMNGKLMSEPARGGATMALTNQGGTKVAFARVTVKAELKLNGKEFVALHGFNRPREADQLIVFTPEFHRTTLTTPDGLEVIVRKNRVQEVRSGKGSAVMPADGFVLSASGRAMQSLQTLRRGIKVEVITQTNATPAFPFVPEVLLGGGPILLANGAVQTNPDGFNLNSFVNTRHPRTAIGVRRDGTVVMVTVDGRQPKKSVGMTIPELAALMLELGCEDAMNLDGGGSTTMVIRNRIVNSVSDATGERPVGDALLILSR